MGSFKDLDVFKKNLERIQGYGETAVYEADSASSEASDAADSIRNVNSVIDDLLQDLDELLGFDTYELENAIEDIKLLSAVITMYARRTHDIVHGTDIEYKSQYRTLINALQLVTTTDSYGNMSFDVGYEIEQEINQAGRIQYVFKKKQEEQNNG